MSNLFGGGGTDKSGVSTTGFGISGGGAGAPWNWGVSPFDQSQIDQATSSDIAALTNRYKQLGLDSSTMEQQDIAGATEAGQTMTGQLQTQNEGNPALNPAIQPPLNTVIGAGGANTNNLGSTLTSLAGKAIGAALPAAFGA